ncbi:MAG: class I SAM-dependent methyltransferase [Eudoraea sp.]|nr:class I SAM-dependent methyltransferase [Eudoraea sp.]
MDNFDRKKHWEGIYDTKDTQRVSWFQPTPETSLDLIKELNIPLTAKIIDVGGGDSLLVDTLLELGYEDITVLDISEKSLENAKKRLGELANQVTWIVADIAEFVPPTKYDLWHDRAAFHFLTKTDEINSYVQTVANGIAPEGKMIIGTFSEQGPSKCSGIEIALYSEPKLTALFAQNFSKIRCKKVDHETPSGALQNFIFCCFSKLSKVR